MSVNSDAELELGAGLPVASESIGDSATRAVGTTFLRARRARSFRWFGELVRRLRQHTHTDEGEKRRLILTHHSQPFDSQR